MGRLRLAVSSGAGAAALARSVMVNPIPTAWSAAYRSSGVTNGSSASAGTRVHVASGT